MFLSSVDAGVPSDGMTRPINRLLSAWCALASLACAFAQGPETEPVVRFDGEMVVRATLRSAQDLMLMGQLSDDPWSHSPGIGAPSDWRLSRDHLPTLHTGAPRLGRAVERHAALVDEPLRRRP